MAVIKRRALYGWIAGLFILGALFAWQAISRPPVPGASAAIVSRVGILTAAVILPVFLGARAIARFTVDNTVAAIVLPVFLSLMIAALVIGFGFTPENARLCSGLARYETIEPDPACFTSTATRLKILAEGYIDWILFGAILALSFRLRERKERRALEAARA